MYSKIYNLCAVTCQMVTILITFFESEMMWIFQNTNIPCSIPVKMSTHLICCMCNNYKSMIKKQFCMKHSMSNRITFLYLLKMLSTFQLLQNLVGYLHRQNFSWSYFYDHNCWQCCQNNPRSHRSTKTTKTLI